MFTGLIAELGEVRSLVGNGEGYKIEIGCQKILQDLKVGDSVAVNGACLTVVKKTSRTFVADVMPETISRTVIGKLHIAEKVNLERTLQIGGGLEGHFVQGHVEGIGKIVHREICGNSIIFRIACDKKLTHYIVAKGSIAIDGISLTVTDVEENNFSVSIIPHTAKLTTLGFKKQGDWVNLETDILARYIEKFTAKQKNIWEDLKKV